MNKKLKNLATILTQMERLQTLQITEKENNISSYPAPEYSKVMVNLTKAAEAMTTYKEGTKDDIPF